MQFICAIFTAILGLCKWDFHLVSMKTNDKQTDKHPDIKKKNAVLNLSIITTFFHIL